jgi:hypothetical protein
VSSPHIRDNRHAVVQPPEIQQRLQPAGSKGPEESGQLAVVVVLVVFLLLEQERLRVAQAKN